MKHFASCQLKQLRFNHHNYATFRTFSVIFYHFCHFKHFCQFLSFLSFLLFSAILCHFCHYCHFCHFCSGRPITDMANKSADMISVSSKVSADVFDIKNDYFKHFQKNIFLVKLKTVKIMQTKYTIFSPFSREIEVCQI